MVLGYHFIFSAYGFWLPNDPRGSWSEAVRELDLRVFGPATKVTTTQSVAHAAHDRELRLAAKKALRYPPVEFTGEQARAIARGFVHAAHERDYVLYALAIMRDHVHLVVGRHVLHVDRIAAHLKASATRQMNDEGVHPLATYVSPSGRVPSPWARKYWCPFIDSVEHMHAAIQYVRGNPPRAGLPPQRWTFVEQFEG